MKLFLTIWSVDLVPVGVYGGLWRKGCSGGLVARHSFLVSKQLMGAGVGGAWC